MRGKGEDSIYQRSSDMRWVASVELRPRDGKRRRKVITARSKEDLLDDLRKVHKALDKSGDIPTSSDSVEVWMNYWMREIASQQVRPKTMANYRSFVNNWIIPILGKKKLDKLTPADVRTVSATMLRGMGKRKPVSETSAATAHRILSSAFSAAQEDGRMTSNPARIAKAPRIPATDLEVLTIPEVIRLLEQFSDKGEKNLWATFMLTGARRGEILGLTWDRVTDVLDLSWQLQRHPTEMVAPADYEYQRLEGGLYLTRPKSKAGWRIVPLVQPLAGLLARWREEQEPNSHGLVFARPDGKPIDPDAASKAWPGILAAAGIAKRVRIHDLRHTAVDMLYEAGVPETVIIEIVGHSSRAMTRAYKSRGNRPQLTDAMRRMSALLGITGDSDDVHQIES